MVPRCPTRQKQAISRVHRRSPPPAPAPSSEQIIVDPIGGAEIQLRDVATGNFHTIRTPFTTFHGPIQVDQGSFSGTGSDDALVFAAGLGVVSHVVVMDTASGAIRSSFYAYNLQYSGGTSIAIGDVNNDGVDDIITLAAFGAATHIKIIDGTRLNMVNADGTIQDAALIASFYAFSPTFLGGGSIAVGDVNGDGQLDLVVGSGVNGMSQVKVIDGKKLTEIGADGTINDSALLSKFYAFFPAFRGGVTVAVGDINGDGKADLVLGAGSGEAMLTSRSWTGAGSAMCGSMARLTNRL